jgi:ribonuclease E
VGKKTPRRERPPIQQALKRGQEIMVQVIKEGIGTKGPTLTSYLSIPGRFLVMMPDMDRVGVSRKVEDDDQRREARKVLDQLELPEGFGFILRTAGIDRGKMELKRDLAYLQRLWKDMERRRKAGNKPRLLYTESDLLVRTLRDALTTEIDEIVIDDANALQRAGRFLKIAAPRSGVKLAHYDMHTPIFHAFGVEKQIEQIHKRDAPLKSGGRLVIDETEALVAIDVNSGKMRSHSDAETTAFKTNMEAADEICRQLKLRDLGGLVVLDLIDMRSKSHRREVETKFKNLFKRDRARTKVLPISQLGLLELTRQRMRGSLQSAHFSNCRVCEGSGLVQRPESVAGDAVRDLASVLAHDVVRRAEMVVSPRVAGELLSSKRKLLGRLERASGKRIDVRVSETIPLDQVTIYAYDERGADIDVERLPEPKTPADLKPWEGAGPGGDNWAVDPSEEPIGEEYDDVEEEVEEIDDSDLSDEAPEDDKPKRKRKRRRRRRRKDDAEGEDRESEDNLAEDARESAGDDQEATPVNGQADVGEIAADENGESQPRKRKRRRRRKRRKGDDATASSNGAAQTGERPVGEETTSEAGEEESSVAEPSAESAINGGTGGASKKRRRRRRRGGRGRGGRGTQGAQTDAVDGASDQFDASKSEAAKTPSEPAPAAQSKPEPEAEQGEPVKGDDSKSAEKKTTRKKSAKKASKKKSAKKTTKKKASKKTARKKSSRSKKSTTAADATAEAGDTTGE